MSEWDDTDAPELAWEIDCIVDDIQNIKHVIICNKNELKRLSLELQKLRKKRKKK